MSHEIPRPTIPLLAALLLVVPALPAPACAAAPVALEIAVQARELAPGEPVRVTVTAPVELASASATLLGEPVFLMPASRRVWTGWTMIALEEASGPTAIDARGLAVDGRDAVGTLAVTVARKEFPSEDLGVPSRYVTPPAEVEARLAREREKLERLYATRSERLPPSEPFVRPVPGANTSVFGTRRLFNGEPRSPHPGLDLRASTGTPVVASGPGRVVLAEELYYSGNTVMLDHGGGLFTLYAHLSSVDVREGDEVSAGQVLGRSGATGRVTGPHLHWGAKIGDRPFDPEALLDPALFAGR